MTICPEQERIAVCGTGAIGTGLAVLFTGNSLPVTVIGHSQAGILRFFTRFEQAWDELIQAGVCKSRHKDAAKGLLTISREYADLADATFILEACAEDLAVKAEVYAQIQAHCRSDAILTSSTSSLTAGQLTALLKSGERFLLTHPFQPSHLLPLFELVPGPDTAESVVQRSKRLLEYCSRQVVVLRKDVPGLIVNRLAQALFRECLYLLEEGVATAEELDRAIHWAVGKRYASIGLLEYFDAVGFSLESQIASNVYPSLCDATSVQEIVRRGLESGKTGIAAGEGLYTWGPEQIADFEQRKSAPFFFACTWHFPE